MNAYMNQYQSTQVQTASPEQILIMLYDGAIRFSRQATEFMQAGQMTAKAEKISRVIAIVSELANTLDHEIGGEIAEELDALYNFMIRELTQANLHNDAAKLTVVENLLSDLRETWMQAIEINRQEKAPAPAPAAEYKPFQAAL
ncbi:MAG: flagellar export chaperone FliS [Desulfuromonadales bacterium]